MCIIGSVLQQHALKPVVPSADQANMLVHHAERLLGKIPSPMRGKAIGILVDMAHSTARCLSHMAASDVPSVLLTLLDEQVR